MYYRLINQNELKSLNKFKLLTLCIVPKGQQHYLHHKSANRIRIDHPLGLFRIDTVRKPCFLDSYTVVNAFPANKRNVKLSLFQLSSFCWWIRLFRSGVEPNSGDNGKAQWGGEWVRSKDGRGPGLKKPGPEIFGSGTGLKNLCPAPRPWKALRFDFFRIFFQILKTFSSKRTNTQWFFKKYIDCYILVRTTEFR